MPGPIVPVPITAARLTAATCPPPSGSWMRRQTRSGVSGSSVIGTPASASAFTIAAGTAASAPSPQPFAPYGPGPSPFSTITQVISSGQVLEARHAVVEQRVVEEQAVLVDHLLEERVAEPLQRRALVLALDELRVDRAADVGDGRRPAHVDEARVRVDLDLGGADADLPEDRALGVRAGADRARPRRGRSARRRRSRSACASARGGRPGRCRVAPGDPLELRADVGGGALHGEAGDRRRAARAGRAVVRREARVGAAHGDAAPARRRAPRPRSARTRCAGPGPSRSSRRGRRRGRRPRAGRPRSRPGARRPRAARPRRRGRRAARFALAPADGGGDLLDVADQVGVERLAAGAHLLARAEQVLRGAPRAGRARRAARPRRPATRRSTAGASRRRRGRSRPARVFV